MPASESSHPNADVRMRGFVQRTTVDAALAWVDSALPARDDLDSVCFRVANIAEPATAGLGLLGLLALACRRNRGRWVIE